MQKLVKYTAAFLLCAVPAQAADISMSAAFGTSSYSYDYSYPYTDYNGDATTLEYDEEIDFSYRDITLNLTQDDGGVFSLKIGGLPQEDDYDPYFVSSTAKRDEYSISYTKRVDSNLSWFTGYYSSEAKLYQLDQFTFAGADYDISYNTTIETGGLFGGLTYSEAVDEDLFWYVRGALQFNWTTFSDDYDWSNSNNNSGGEYFSRDLEGSAVLFAIGVFMPVSDRAGLNFGYEIKSYDYDNELTAIDETPTTLTEDQSSIIISASYAF